VKINIPQHLINLRRDIVSKRLESRRERIAYRLWAWVVASPVRYRLMCAAQRLVLRRRARDGWVSKMPAPGAGWTDVRDMPAPAPKSFHQLWRRRPR
jgi:L-lactate dehydrogenase complex protein LldF